MLAASGAFALLPAGPTITASAAGSAPVAIAELGIAGLHGSRPGPTFDSGCRRDLVWIDDQPLPIRVPSHAGNMVIVAAQG